MRFSKGVRSRNCSVFRRFFGNLLYNRCTDDPRELRLLSKIPACFAPPQLNCVHFLKCPKLTEGRLLPRCGAFGPLKNLLPLMPSVHCLGRRYEAPNAPIDRLEQQQIFRQIPHPAPIAHIALSAVRPALFLSFLCPFLPNFTISRNFI